jgi:hypothetical protein
MSNFNVGQMLIDTAGAVVAQIQAGATADRCAGLWQMPYEVSEITDVELDVELTDNVLHVGVLLSNTSKSELCDRDSLKTEAVVNVIVRMHPPEASLDWQHTLVWITGEILRFLAPTAANAGLSLPTYQAAHFDSVKWLRIFDADLWREHRQFNAILSFTYTIFG